MSEAKRLKVLEDDNSRLKRLLAGATLHNTALKEIIEKILTPFAKWQAVGHIQETSALNERRICSLVGVATRVAR